MNIMPTPIHDAMSLKHIWRLFWLGLKGFSKTKTAKEFQVLCKSELVFEQFLASMRLQAINGAVQFTHYDLPISYQNRLRALGFKVDVNNQQGQTAGYAGLNSGLAFANSPAIISWEEPPTVADYDGWIAELQEKRDDLRKEELIKELAGAV